LPKLPRLTAKEAEKLLLEAEFSCIRSTGSHRIYRKNETRVVIPLDTIRIDDRDYPLVPGTCVAVEVGESHEITNNGDRDLIVTYFGIRI
jgi:predicted RNA binding protein YcfA (HicA-like mRNA interferase family)